MKTKPTIKKNPRDIIADWFHMDSFSHLASRKDAAQALLDLLDENDFIIVKKRHRSFYLRFHERNAAIRAYNSKARDTLSRGEMIDAIIDAVNEERGGDKHRLSSVREMQQR